MQVFAGIRVCNHGGSQNGAVLDLCSALVNARVKGLFGMLFIAWSPAVVKAMIPARRDQTTSSHLVFQSWRCSDLLQPAWMFGCDLCNYFAFGFTWFY